MRSGQHICVSGAIKGIRTPSEFKIFFSNPKGGKILNSTANCRESISGGRTPRLLTLREEFFKCRVY